MKKKISLPIIFFEEYPFLEENQKKAELIDFPSILFLPAKDLKEFDFLKEKYLSINANLEIGWWPFFNSIWLSPFTFSEEIEKLIFELENRKKREEKIKVLLDLELPFLRPQYFFSGIFYFKKSKKKILQLIEQSEKMNVEIFTFEYPPNFLIFPFFLEKLGLTYLKAKTDYKRILACYTSSNLIILRQFYKFSIIKAVSKSTRKTFVALGLLARGRILFERRITKKGLKKDLEYFLNKGISNFAFFRLGGLNPEYLKIIKEFL